MAAYEERSQARWTEGETVVLHRQAMPGQAPRSGTDLLAVPRSADHVHDFARGLLEHRPDIVAALVGMLPETALEAAVADALRALVEAAAALDHARAASGRLDEAADALAEAMDRLRQARGRA